MSKQKLDFGDDLSDAIEFALQVFLRNAGLARPRPGDEARADAQTQHRGRLPAVSLDLDGLANQAAAHRDLPVRLAADRHLAQLTREGTMDGPAGLRRQRTSVPLNHERKDRGAGEFPRHQRHRHWSETRAGEATATA